MIMLENKATDLKKRSGALVELKKKELDKEAHLRAQHSPAMSSQ
jgi:hypothetical protein